MGRSSARMWPRKEGGDVHRVGILLGSFSSPRVLTHPPWGARVERQTNEIQVTTTHELLVSLGSPRVPMHFLVARGGRAQSQTNTEVATHALFERNRSNHHVCIVCTAPNRYGDWNPVVKTPCHITAALSYIHDVRRMVGANTVPTPCLHCLHPRRPPHGLCQHRASLCEPVLESTTSAAWSVPTLCLFMKVMEKFIDLGKQTVPSFDCVTARL